MATSSADPSIAVASLDFFAAGLARPECVLATARGDLYVSDRSGGVCRIRPDGRQNVIGSGADILPNGIALRRDGSFLVANLNSRGGVWHIAPDGHTTPFLLEVAGSPVPGVNFVRIDEHNRVWICANPPLTSDGRYRTEKAEGYIVLIDTDGPRIVADAIGWANECLIDPSGRYLFVNETFARCVTRFTIAVDGSLSNRITYDAVWPRHLPGRHRARRGRRYLGRRRGRQPPGPRHTGRTPAHRAGRQRPQGSGHDRPGLHETPADTLNLRQIAGQNPAHDLQHRFCRAGPAHCVSWLPCGGSFGYVSLPGGGASACSLGVVTKEESSFLEKRTKNFYSFGFTATAWNLPSRTTTGASTEVP